MNIIITTYKPDDTLLTAIRNLIAERRSHYPDDVQVRIEADEETDHIDITSDFAACLEAHVDWL
jgi:hypothetical protein